MVQGFDLSLTKRQAELVEYALRVHIKELVGVAEEAHNAGDRTLALEAESSANVVRNTLSQVKNGLYNIFKQEI